jgi:tetratricopeptide (TPR) repeat protein
LIQRGIAFTRLGNHKAALSDFDKAVKLDINSYAGFNNRGACYLNLQMNTEAIKDFTTAVSLNNQIADGFYNRHIAYYRIGDNEKAATDLAQAAKIDPSIRAAPKKSPPSRDADHSILIKPPSHR